MIRVLSLLLILASCLIQHVHGQEFSGPDTVLVRSGDLTLKGLVWHPSGPGRFPTVLFSHGNYATESGPGTVDALLGPTTSASLLGPVFARNGYVFLVVFRRGVGLSMGQGVSSLDRLLGTLADRGQHERNILQIQLLETEQLDDLTSGLRLLRARQDVDTARIGVLGHSFGGSLALLLAEHDPSIRAVVTFGAGAGSWNISPELRARLTRAATAIRAPVFLIHARNDYSTGPADSLGAVMDRLRKPYRVKIYPPFGNNTDVGHNFIFLGGALWERDVMGFLEENLRH